VHLDHILNYQGLDEPDESKVLNFFDKHILHRTECMALLGKLEKAISLLRQIELSPHVRHMLMCTQYKLTSYRPVKRSAVL
jgi:hypothetical protein